MWIQSKVEVKAVHLVLQFIAMFYQCTMKITVWGLVLLRDYVDLKQGSAPFKKKPTVSISQTFPANNQMNLPDIKSETT